MWQASVLDIPAFENALSPRLYEVLSGEPLLESMSRLVLVAKEGVFQHVDMRIIHFGFVCQFALLHLLRDELIDVALSKMVDDSEIVAF